HDDRHAGLGPDATAYLHAVQAGEHDVEEDEVGTDGAEGSDRRGSVGDVGHIEPLVAQHDAEHLRERGVVIDDEHTTLHLASFLPLCGSRLSAPHDHHIFITDPEPTAGGRKTAPPTHSTHRHR